MPSIETPLFTDLRPFEELSVAARAGETATEATTRGVAGGFQKNLFTAFITNIGFFEDPPLAEGESVPPTPGSKRNRGGSQPTKPESATDTVRVSLVARVALPHSDRMGSDTAKTDRDANGAASSSQSSTGRPSTQTITIASWTFDSHTSGTPLVTVAAASPTNTGKSSASKAELPAHLSFHPVCLKVPLVFRSDSPVVQSLGVVAHAIPKEAMKVAAEKDTMSVPMKLKPYSGRRCFGVRVFGMQQTELSSEQVLLLST